MDDSLDNQETNDASPDDVETSGTPQDAEEETIGIKGYTEYEEEMDTSDEEVPARFRRP